MVRQPDVPDQDTVVVPVSCVQPGMVRMLYRIPARGLFGYRSEFMTDTRGNGIMHHRFLEYGPWAGPLAGIVYGKRTSKAAPH